MCAERQTAQRIGTSAHILFLGEIVEWTGPAGGCRCFFPTVLIDILVSVVAAAAAHSERERDRDAPFSAKPLRWVNGMLPKPAPFL